MSEHRRPEEVAVAVRRPGKRDTEFLVVLRSQAKLGYWHVIAGGVEWDETPAAAAARELREETGLEAEPEPLGDPLAYDLSGDPESVRERFAEEPSRSSSGRSSPTRPRAGSLRSTRSTSTIGGSTPTTRSSCSTTPSRASSCGGLAR